MVSDSNHDKMNEDDFNECDVLGKLRNLFFIVNKNTGTKFFCKQRLLLISLIVKTWFLY